jgi:hypothetical protein
MGNCLDKDALLSARNLLYLGIGIQTQILAHVLEGKLRADVFSFY